MPDREWGADDKADMNAWERRKKFLILPRFELPSPGRPSGRLVVTVNELSRFPKFINHITQ